MQIRELLNRLDRLTEVEDPESYEDFLKKQNKLPTDSNNDSNEKPTEPEEPDTGMDDSEEDLEDREESQNVKKFKEYAKDIGGDMFSLSMWNYDETWQDASSGPNEKIKKIIQQLADETMDGSDDSVVQKYVRQGSRTLFSDRILTQMIYDARHKRLFNLIASLEDGVDTSDVDFLDQDQADILSSMFELLDNWTESIANSKPYTSGVSDWQMGKDQDSKWSALEDKVLSTLTKSLPSERDIKVGGWDKDRIEKLDIDKIIKMSLDDGDIDTARKLYKKHKDHPNLKKDWSKELAPRAKRK